MQPVITQDAMPTTTNSSFAEALQAIGPPESPCNGNCFYWVLIMPGFILPFHPVVRTTCHNFGKKNCHDRWLWKKKIVSMVNTIHGKNFHDNWERINYFKHCNLLGGTAVCLRSSTKSKNIGSSRTMRWYNISSQLIQV